MLFFKNIQNMKCLHYVIKYVELEQEIIILTKQISKLNKSIRDNGDYNPQRLA